MLLPHELELLAPAKTTEIAREAILHGADAVYIGGPAFGARHNAGNAVGEIAELVRFARRYHARIMVTLNTILHEAELEPARRLVHQLYEAGVDALIVQDMGLLELDIPPIELHASTQCDIRTPWKAQFLADVGFSQVVLARELSIHQIRETATRLKGKAAIEYFIHGALCVAYSGQCNISHAETGRSANRGDCSQACRLPFTLTDLDGRVIAYDKHLLSMKDNNQSDNLWDLVDAGVQSFKIEGRYKDMSYVKNITAHYRGLLDEIMAARPEFAPASSGRCEYTFSPNPDKTFHRGATDYFATGRKEDIGAFDSPKFVGTPIGEVTAIGKNWFEMSATEALANGDGLNYLNKREVIGVQANTVELRGDVWRVFPNEAMSELPGLKAGVALNRNRDHVWDQALLKPSATRRIDIWMTLAETTSGLELTLTDSEGCTASARVDLALEPAKNPERAEATLTESLGKLGNTIFNAIDIQLALSQPWFVPAGTINALRREAVEKLEAVRVESWQPALRRAEVEPPVPYPETELSFLANVYNPAARAFYERHGVKVIKPAFEAHEEAGEVPVMITKHCLRYSFKLCPKQAKGVTGVQGQVRAEPLMLVNSNDQYRLEFDCRPCEMHVMGQIRKNILKSPQPGSGTITFYKKRPQ